MTADTEEKLIELKATALVYKLSETDDIIETIHKVKDGIIAVYTTSWKKKILAMINILKLTIKIMKYCNDCLTPMKRDSKEDYCDLCKKARVNKENSVS